MKEAKPRFSSIHLLNKVDGKFWRQRETYEGDQNPSLMLSSSLSLWPHMVFAN